MTIFAPKKIRSGARFAGRKAMLRWALLVAGVILFNILAARGLAGFVETRLGAGISGGAWIGVATLAAYTVVLAVPFISGMEIGVSLLIMQGAAVAPFVHAATVIGLSIAYAFGSAFATTLPCTFLRHLGFPNACAFVDAMKDLGRADRLRTLQDTAPPWVGRWIIRHRHILLAVLINLPGNSFVGGGGGILLVTGLSRLFSYPAVLLTLVLATAPVPWAVWLLGTEVLR